MSDYSAGTNGAPLITTMGGASGQGTSTHPWNSLQAAFTSQTGYPTALLSTVNGSTGPIQPGDEIVLANGNYGEITGGGTGVPANQIINIPAVTIAGSPSSIISTIALSGVTGFVFNGPTVQSQNTDGISLVNIQDGNNVGYANSNIVLMNMAVNSAPLATVQGWTQAQFVTSARPGVFIQGSNQGAGMSCASVINVHVSGIHFKGSGAITVVANSMLVQNDEVDHFTAQGIQYNATGVAILGNYVHDVYNDNYDGDLFDYKGAIQGIGAFPTLIRQHNIYIARNLITDGVDRLLPTPAAALQGIESTVGDWTNVVIIDNKIASSGCGALLTGNVHNALVANNSIIDGGDSSLQPGCVPSLTVAQAHGGGTGPANLFPSNVRISNNLVPSLYFTGSNVQADHNIQTGLTGAGFIYSPWGIPAGNAPGLIYTGPVIGSVNPAPAAAGVTNLLDGLGAANEFTAVPVPASHPLAPLNWALLPGSPAKTSGGASFIPPITDFNRAAFAPPYSIGALN
jgi:hypothetical protein